MATVGSYEGGVSYERGTPFGQRSEVSAHVGAIGLAFEPLAWWMIQSGGGRGAPVRVSGQFPDEMQAAMTGRAPP